MWPLCSHSGCCVSLLLFDSFDIRRCAKFGILCHSPSLWIDAAQIQKVPTAVPGSTSILRPTLCSCRSPKAACYRLQVRARSWCIQNIMCLYMRRHFVARQALLVATYIQYAAAHRSLYSLPQLHRCAGNSYDFGALRKTDPPVRYIKHIQIVSCAITRFCVLTVTSSISHQIFAILFCFQRTKDPPVRYIEHVQVASCVPNRQQLKLLLLLRLRTRWRVLQELHGRDARGRARHDGCGPIAGVFARG